MPEVDYLSGFGNHHASEAQPGVLPHQQNNPQRVAGGYYTEQLSGTAFTVARANNQRTWLYRARPSVRHISSMQPLEHAGWRSAPLAEAAPATQLRWSPFPIEDTPHDWLDGLVTVAAGGDFRTQRGAATMIYTANRSMVDTVIVNADGELLIVPQVGALRLVTELGVLELSPSEMAVIPRGIKFMVELVDNQARGYVCENHGAPFTLPDAGLIGLNALAQPRDFLYPVAQARDPDRPTRMVMRFGGQLWHEELAHSPLDVVAWHGNYAPYKFDLRAFSPIGSVLVDHPDPSIWTVLTSPSESVGTANVDFVLFRERWLVQEHTFRPPWFHSNVMSEFMGLIEGVYDAKRDGFAPGGMSIHNAFVPHGPDPDAFERGSTADLEPVRLEPSLAVMFESRYVWTPTERVLRAPERQLGYPDQWGDLNRNQPA